VSNLKHKTRALALLKFCQLPYLNEYPKAGVGWLLFIL